LLGLADAAPHQHAAHRTAELEARIRRLHASLEAAGGSAAAPQADKQQEQQEQVAGGGQAHQWSIPAVRLGQVDRPACRGQAAPTAAAGQPLADSPAKAALRQQPSLTPAAAQGPPSAGLGAGGEAAPQLDPSLPGTVAARPGRQCEGGRQQSMHQQPEEAEEEEGQGTEPARRWQPDDGLAAYERSTERVPYKPSPPLRGSTGEVHQAATPPAAPSARSASDGQASSASRAASPGVGGDSPQGSPPARRLPDPLARGRGGGDSSPRPGSPAEGGSGPQPVLQLASGEGRWEQVRPVRILGCGQSAASCTPVPIAQSSVG
jgi:hypothetical protein